MIITALICFLLFCAPLSYSYIYDEDLNSRYTKRTENGIHIPLHRTYQTLTKRAESGGTKFGDYFDLVYTVLLSIGTVITPVVVSTGTSDLWVYSDECAACNTSGAPLYPQVTFQPAGLDASFVFGGEIIVENSVSGTIGKDTVGIARVHTKDQYFASINSSTNTIGFAAVGFFGLGFPSTSLVWRELVARKAEEAKGLGLTDPIGETIQASFSTFAPLLFRMVANQILKEPSFTVTLQRTTIELTGRTPGILSLGELPEGVRNESLHWVPVRPYLPSEGGIPQLPVLTTEVYPSYWEIFIDDVFFDGKRLPPSKLAPANLQTSALVDMGTVFVHGPSDIVSEIRSQMRGSNFPCGEPHTLAFQIGGVLFPIDPRDLIYSPDRKSATVCNAFLADITMPDTTVPGPRHSWILGAPFLRGVVASFYYGIIQPSSDPSRMGFLSRVPVNAGDLLKKAVEKGTFPYLSEELSGSGPVATDEKTSTTTSSILPPTSTAGVSSATVLNTATLSSWLYICCTLVVLAAR